MSLIWLFFPKRRLTCAAVTMLSVFLVTISMLFLENVNLMRAAPMDEDPNPSLIFKSESQQSGRIRNRLLFDHTLNVSVAATHISDGDEEESIHHQYSNADPIRLNPLNVAQCQNALIDHYDLDKDELLSRHLSKIRCDLPKRPHQKNRNQGHAFVPHIWSREFISALQSEACFEPRTPVRSVADLYSAGHYQKEESPIPVFYHIPKCGSSSTAAMTSDLFNFTIHWQEGPERMHDAIRTRCGFAFIRDPLNRFISAYYTINKKCV